MTDNNNQQYVTWFRDSSPYINRHRGKAFVLMLPGTALAHGNIATIVQDIALLNSLGIKLVLVLGARQQIDLKLEQASLASDFHNGTRITTDAMLGPVIEVFGKLRTTMEAMLSMGLPNSPMHLSRIKVNGGNMITAQPLGVHEGIDFQHSGVVRKVDGDAISAALATNSIVMLPALGYSPSGEVFNLKAADAAVHIAEQLDADKLIAYHHEPILDNQGEAIRQLTVTEARYLSDRLDHESDILETIIKANQGGVERCHVIDFHDDGALIKELFSRDGCGCMIYHDNYDNIRTASIADIGGIIELIEPMEESGALVARPRERLEQEVANFIVVERDGMLVGCAAIYPFTTSNAAEIACVVTHPAYQGKGVGEKLMAYVERQARLQGLGSLFVLTTQTAHWFIEQGFEAAELKQLPSEKQSLYNYNRNSKVHIKPL